MRPFAEQKLYEPICRRFKISTSCLTYHDVCQREGVAHVLTVRVALLVFVTLNQVSRFLGVVRGLSPSVVAHESQFGGHYSLGALVENGTATKAGP